jgi:hypothetical protein
MTSLSEKTRMTRHIWWREQPRRTPLLPWWPYVLWLATFLALLGLCLWSGSRACAHDAWSNGEKIPNWIKSACCGQAEAHVLGSGEYMIGPDGFHVIGIDTPFPISQILPSQDGKVWAFYNNTGQNAVIHCVFYSGSI